MSWFSETSVKTILLLAAICIAPIFPVISEVLWLVVVNWKLLQDL